MKENSSFWETNNENTVAKWRENRKLLGHSRYINNLHFQILGKFIDKKYLICNKKLFDQNEEIKFSL